MPGKRMADWLSRLADDALAAVLDRRPEAVLGRPPSTLGLLAERLSHPDSLVAALRGLTAAGLQVLEAVQALGERRTRPALIALLDGPAGVEHEAAVDAVLAELTAAALVWPGEGDRLEVPSGLEQVLPVPLGLGPPARAGWADQNVDAIGRALRALGGRPEGRKADKLEALLARFADPERIRAQAAQAPPAIAADLRRLAWAGVDGENDDDLYNRFDPEAYRQRRETEQWAVAHGLLAGETWGYGYAAPMPAEVALALRGPDFRTPFTPRPPSVLPHDVAPKIVESAAAAAITAFTAHAVALLDRVARTPVPQLAGGGVGVRELGRLAKELGVEEIEVRLVLALAAATELLWPNDDGALGVGEQFDQWRQAEPAIQAASLVAAWWVFPAAPTQARDDNGKALPVLLGTEPCGGCQAARVVLLEVAAGQPAGTAADPGELARLARWHRPLVHVLPQDAEAPLATVWREAELLGVVAAGAVSPLGAALIADDIDAVLGGLRRMLPGVSDTATFGSDLTVVVAGVPSARVTGVLDGCADRESSGGAVTWRFGPASVRRALDAGTTAEALIEELTGIAGRELPQPLAYLIGDIGRRHGRLRLLPTVSLIRSDDEALLAEVAADRRLAGLGLQRVAPTVLSCAVPLEQALVRLREVGYFPVAEPASAASGPGRERRPVPSGGRSAPRRPTPARPATEVDPRVLAEELLAAGAVELPAFSGTAAVLARSAPDLSSDEVDQLAAAVEAGGRLRITYCAASGAVTRRVIRDPDLAGGMLYAWCELRQDDRVFAVSRIRSVGPA